MKILFDSTNYKEFLNNLVYSAGVARGTQVKVAKALGCQAAYLSQVLKGKAELNEDHAIGLANYLKLSPAAKEYLLLLIRLARARTPALRSHLEQKRAELQEQLNSVGSRVAAREALLASEELQKYFTTWIPSTVHMATSADKYQTAQSIAARLKLDVEKVTECLHFLEQNSLVTRQGSKWKFSSSPLHFSRNSLCNTPHQICRRNQAIRSIEYDDPEDLHFSSIFTISGATAKALRQRALDFIQSSHQEIQASGTDELYSICLDFFKV